MENHESPIRCNTFNAILFDVRILLRVVINRHARVCNSKRVNI